MMSPLLHAAFALVYSWICLVTFAGARTKRSLADISATGSTRSGAQTLLSRRTNVKEPISSGWFGDFNFGESTFTGEGLGQSKDYPAYNVEFGRDPSVETGLLNDQPPTYEFFHESQSGGPDGAWQTHYPVGHIEQNGPGNAWRYTPSGWVNEYKEPIEFSGLDHRPGAWFDNSVNQVDDMGRQRMPEVGQDRFFRDGSWLERSVNTTVTCKTPGCTGSSSLNLYDPDTEEACRCSISVFVHPTDYDDDWSTEHIEYWKINGEIATRQCNPRARGCNSTAEKPLYPCLNTYNVDGLINSKGVIVLEGKNTPYVDECADNGNLLSAVVIGTCDVRNRRDTTTTTTTTLHPDAVHVEAVLKCATPGCTAETTLHFIPMFALNGGTCTMSANVTQTDYDAAAGEVIEYLRVEGKNMTTKVKPGKNPCKMVYEGKNVTAADRIFSAVTKFDVTDLAKTSHPLGKLTVTGQISHLVDECGHDGNLLYAIVAIDCAPKK